MVNILFWLAFGALVGWIGSILNGSASAREIAKLIGTGVTAALLGGMCGQLFTTHKMITGYASDSITLAVIAAIAAVLAVVPPRENGKG